MSDPHYGTYVYYGENKPKDESMRPWVDTKAEAVRLVWELLIFQKATDIVLIQKIHSDLDPYNAVGAKFNPTRKSETINFNPKAKPNG